MSKSIVTESRLVVSTARGRERQRVTASGYRDSLEGYEMVLTL